MCSHESKTAELKDAPNSMEHIQEHDLIEAALSFTLTNHNTSNFLSSFGLKLG